jgi:hypothetical protein
MIVTSSRKSEPENVSAGEGRNTPRPFDLLIFLPPVPRASNAIGAKNWRSVSGG